MQKTYKSVPASPILIIPRIIIMGSVKISSLPRKLAIPLSSLCVYDLVFLVFIIIHCGLKVHAFSSCVLYIYSIFHECVTF